MLVIFLPDNTGIQRHCLLELLRLTHRVDGIVLLCLGEVEGKDLLWSDVFLTDDPSVDIVLHHDLAHRLDAVESVVVVDLVVEAVHPILVYRETSEDG